MVKKKIQADPTQGRPPDLASLSTKEVVNKIFEAMEGRFRVAIIGDDPVAMARFEGRNQGIQDAMDAAYECLVSLGVPVAQVEIGDADGT